MDRRLGWFVVGLGTLLLLWAGVQAVKGGSVWVPADATIGGGLVLAGLLGVTGRRFGPPTAWALCLLAALVQAARANATGRAIPSVPFGVLAVALLFALGADRRARRRRRG